MKLAAMAGVHIPQQDSPGVVVRTTPCPPLLCSVSVIHAPRIDVGRRDVHLRQASDGTLMIGQGTQESLNRDDSQEHANELLARAKHYLPSIADASAVPVPVGYRPMPIDGFPGARVRTIRTQSLYCAHAQRRHVGAAGRRVGNP